MKRRKNPPKPGRAIHRRPPSLNGKAVVDVTRLAPHNSYDDPEFVKRGYYQDKPFTCRDCGKAEIWTATQQKWWYEIARGEVFTQASRCRNCRRRERKRREEARRVHLEGLASKRNGQAADDSGRT